MKSQILVCGSALILLAGAVRAEKGSGPLRVHPTNPRYFTDGKGGAIYLTGSHTWTNTDSV